MIAPGRARRPGARGAAEEPPSPEELARCPFCEGREDRTPPEVFAIADGDRSPDSPGWKVRVVPNLYPAFQHQEVIVHTPRHVRTLAELEDDELPPVAGAWHARLGAAHEAGIEHPLLALNEGRAAGASLAHTHSQLVWLSEAPPAIADEAPNLRKNDCALCTLLADDELEIAVRGSLSLRAAFAGRLPYELLIAPREHEARPDEAALLGALELLRDGIRRLRGLEGDVALNAWLHASGHWHFEVLPRLSVLAGLELGAGVFVNWLPPEEAAARLRG